MGPSNCIYTEKVTLKSLPTNTPGQTYYPLVRALKSGTSIVRAAQQIPVRITGFSVGVFFEEPHWTAGHYLGKIRIEPHTFEPVPVTISLLVYREGETDTALGWDLMLFPQSTATVYTTPFTITFQLTPPSTAIPDERFVMKAIVTGDNKQFTSEPSEIVIPEP